MSLLLPDPAALRAKCAAFRGPLADYWDAFLRRARAHPAAHPVDNAVAFCGTGEAAYGEAFVEAFEELLTTLPSRDATNQGQFHQWTNALPLTRWLLAWDLLAECDVVPAGQHQRAARAFLGYARRQFLPVMQSRELTGDNQFFAVAFACRVVGHLFGRVHGASGQARALAAEGARRLSRAPGALPPGGYSGEGYYHNQVVATLASLFCAFEETATGADLFEHPWPPHGVRVRDILEVDYQSVLPGGLMLPWDASYYHPLHVKMNLVYLARRSGEAKYLAPLRRFDLFEGDPRPGWGRDDDAWTWLWWPDDVVSFADVPDWTLTHWSRPRVGFGLLSPAAETGLVQSCDFHEERGSPAASRCQSDPNQIILVGRGAPLLLDGGFPRLPEGLDQTPPARRGRTGRTGVGHHNCVVVDGHHSLGAPAAGSGALTRSVPFPRFGLGETDGTDVYRELGVTQMRRRSIRLADDLFLVCDRVRAERPVRATWQVFARPYATVAGDGVVVDTPERLRLTILPLAPTPWRIEPCAKMPAVLENRAHRIARDVRGAEVDFCHLLAVDRLTEPVVPLHEGWQPVAAGGAAAGPAVDLRRGLAVQRDAPPPPLPQRHIWDYMDRRKHKGEEESYDEISFERGVCLERTVPLPAGAPAEGMRLRMARPPWYFRLYADGELVAGAGAPSPTGAGEGSVVAPLSVPLPPPAGPDRTWRLRLEIARPYPSTAVGELTLERPVGAPAVDMAARGAGAVLRRGAERLLLVPDNPAGEVREVEELATDAEMAVLRDAGEWAVLDAAELTCGGERLLTVRGGRASLCRREGCLWVAGLDEDAVARVRLPEGEITLTGGALHRVTARLSAPLRLAVPPRADHAGLPRLVGSPPIAGAADGDWVEVDLEPVVAGAEVRQALSDGDAFAREEAVETLGSVAGREAEELLLAALEDRAWTVVVAAARALGERGGPRAAAALADLLQRENATDVYHGLYDQEAFPQYPGGSNADPLTERGALPAAALAIPEPGTVSPLLKRWRVKQAVIEALGLAADADVVPLLVACLEGADREAGLGMTGGEFYPVRHAVAKALGRLGGEKAAAALGDLAAGEAEVNTRRAAAVACRRIREGQRAER